MFILIKTSTCSGKKRDRMKGTQKPSNISKNIKNKQMVQLQRLSFWSIFMCFNRPLHRALKMPLRTRCFRRQHHATIAQPREELEMWGLGTVENHGKPMGNPWETDPYIGDLW